MNSLLSLFPLLFVLLAYASTPSNSQEFERALIDAIDPLYIAEYTRLGSRGFKDRTLSAFIKKLRVAMILGSDQKAKRHTIIFDMRRMLDCQHPQRIALNDMLDLCESRLSSNSFTWSTLIRDRLELQHAGIYPYELLNSPAIHHRILHLILYSRLAHMSGLPQLFLHILHELTMLLDMYKYVPDRTGTKFCIEGAIRTISSR